MSNLRIFRFNFILSINLLIMLQTSVFCYQFKVGDLDSWGIPTSSDPLIYSKWSKYHTFRIGDSLLFLYPPSQDSVIQVTEESYSKCKTSDPILYMDNGNSLFNITQNGAFYFTSGVQGHCEKKQKLQILVGNSSGVAYSPSYGPGEADSPSYPTVFGSIPAAPSASISSSSCSSLAVQRFLMIALGFVGFFVSALINGVM